MSSNSPRIQLERILFTPLLNPGLIRVDTMIRVLTLTLSMTSSMLRERRSSLRNREVLIVFFFIAKLYFSFCLVKFRI